MQRRLDDARRVWASLGGEERRADGTSATGENLVRAFFEAKQFRAALEVRRDIALSDERLPAPGQISNSDFEADIPVAGSQLFGWQVISLAQAQIHLDPR